MTFSSALSILIDKKPEWPQPVVPGFFKDLLRPLCNTVAIYQFMCKAKLFVGFCKMEDFMKACYFLFNGPFAEELVLYHYQDIPPRGVHDLCF